MRRQNKSGCWPEGQELNVSFFDRRLLHCNSYICEAGWFGVTIPVTSQTASCIEHHGITSLSILSVQQSPASSGE